MVGSLIVTMTYVKPLTPPTPAQPPPPSIIYYRFKGNQKKCNLLPPHRDARRLSIEKCCFFYFRRFHLLHLSKLSFVAPRLPTLQRYRFPTRRSNCFKGEINSTVWKPFIDICNQLNVYFFLPLQSTFYEHYIAILTERYR